MEVYKMSGNLTNDWLRWHVRRISASTFLANLRLQFLDLLLQFGHLLHCVHSICETKYPEYKTKYAECIHKFTYLSCG